MDLAALRTEVDRVMAGNATPEATLQAVCGLLAEGVPHYDWVGFYLVWPDEPRTLRLGPYVGAPTDHTRIPFGRGICGQVAEREESLVVPDVAAEDNYLACSLDVKAEVVVPVFVDGRFSGQLDIDSHTPDPFAPEERPFLEEVCARVAPVVAALLDAPEGVG
jgi:GAF domain-containing protein